MPTYEYHCAVNGRVVEVQHKMADRLSTWGELCQRAGLAPGNTDPASPVQKLVSAGFINTGASSAAPVCETGGCGSNLCGGGACALQ